MLISLLNLKGGVGKTTSCIALATAAARDGKEVIVLDADPQGSASFWADAAEDAEKPLPFEVDAANPATIKRAAKKYKGDAGTYVFIDCPPSGNVLEAAQEVSDFVVIPTGTGNADLVKTLETSRTVEANRIPSAILLTRVLTNTNAFRDVMRDLEVADKSYFDTFIRQKEDLRGYFGAPFGSALYGYENVYNEIKGALE